MQTTIQLQSAPEREARLRRSAILTALYALAIIVVFALGLWMMLALSIPEGFFAAIAGAAALSDPLRHHLHEIIN